MEFFYQNNNLSKFYIKIKSVLRIIKNNFLMENVFIGSIRDCIILIGNLFLLEHISRNNKLIFLSNKKFFYVTY